MLQSLVYYNIPTLLQVSLSKSKDQCSGMHDMLSEIFKKIGSKENTNEVRFALRYLMYVHQWFTSFLL